MIAKKAGVPVAICVPNYRDKIFDIGEVIHLTGNYEEDYKKVINDPTIEAGKAKKPENYTVERIK